MFFIGLFLFFHPIAAVTFYTHDSQRVELRGEFELINSFFYSINGPCAVKFEDTTSSFCTIKECTFSYISGENEVVFDFPSLFLLHMEKNCIDHITASETGAIMNVSFRFNNEGTIQGDYSHYIHTLSAFQCEGNGPILSVHTRTEYNFELKYSNLTKLHNKNNKPGVIKIEDFKYDVFECTFSENTATNAVLYLVNGKGSESWYSQVHRCNFIKNYERQSGVVHPQSGYFELYEASFSENGERKDLYSSAQYCKIYDIYCNGFNYEYNGVVIRPSNVQPYSPFSLSFFNTYEVCFTYPIQKTPKNIIPKIFGSYLRIR